MSIVVHELCKRFGTLLAVDRVSFEIGTESIGTGCRGQGGIVGLIGPNGAGKSSILRILSTFLQPTSGRVIVAGYDTATNPQRVRERIGYLPESPPGSAEARIEEYLEFRARLKGISRAERRTEIDRCLAACQLTAVRRRLIGRLSQGFKRRVGLADALLARPRVLLLDEPTIGLDPLQVRQTRELLAGLAENCTILLSTHLLAEAEGLCQRVLVLMNGRLVSDVKVTELHESRSFEIQLSGPRSECEQMLRDLPHAKSVELISTIGEWLKFAVTGGEAGSRELAAQQCLLRGWRLRELRAVAGTLEDHFLRVAVRGRKEAA
jgi:ABC-2 type transport system ATP-binding protein